MIRLIRRYKEGLSIWKCFHCGHIFNVAKGSPARCLYCGNKKVESEHILSTEKNI